MNDKQVNEPPPPTILAIKLNEKSIKETGGLYISMTLKQAMGLLTSFITTIMAIWFFFYPQEPQDIERAIARIKTELSLEMNTISEKKDQFDESSFLHFVSFFSDHTDELLFVSNKMSCDSLSRKIVEIKSLKQKINCK